MIPSEWLFDFLKRYERLRPTAYKPTPNDVFTCGYGHTRDVVETTTCDMAQALEWLHEDTAYAAGQVNSHVMVSLTQAQFDALVSIVFNVGPGRAGGKDGIITLKSGEPSTLLRLLNAGDYHGAAAEFPKWHKQGGRVLAGLVTRRKDEMEHFL